MGFKREEPDLCAFAPTHQVEKWFYAPSLRTAHPQISKGDAESTFIVTGSALVRHLPASPQPNDAVEKAAVMRELRRAGYGGAIPKSQGMREVAGQPCKLTAGPAVARCTWTGGEQ